MQLWWQVSCLQAVNPVPGTEEICNICLRLDKYCKLPCHLILSTAQFKGLSLFPNYP